MADTPITDKDDNKLESLKSWAYRERARIVLAQAYPGLMVKYGGALYEVASIDERGMIGIYDEPPTKHVDFLNPRNVTIPQTS